MLYLRGCVVASVLECVRTYLLNLGKLSVSANLDRPLHKNDVQGLLSNIPIFLPFFVPIFSGFYFLRREEDTQYVHTTKLSTDIATPLQQRWRVACQGSTLETHGVPGGLRPTSKSHLCKKRVIILNHAYLSSSKVYLIGTTLKPVIPSCRGPYPGGTVRTTGTLWTSSSVISNKLDPPQHVHFLMVVTR